MRLRNTLLCIIVFMAMLSPSFSQSKLPLKEQTTDETGSLRYFRISDSVPNKKVTDAVTLLKMVLNTDENTGFKLVKSKRGENNRQDILYQQLYNNVPVYDCYYYLHFNKDTFSYANGEYSKIERAGNTRKLSETAVTDAAVTYVSQIKGLTPISTTAEQVLWRQNAESLYRYAYKVQVIFSDAAKSKECMVDAETGKVLSAVNIVCSVNVACAGATVYSGNRNFTGDTFGGGTRLRETRNNVNISTLNNQNNAEINPVDFTNATVNWTSANPNQGALDVHFATERFLDYFRTTYNRNSINNAGHQITSYVNRWERISPTVTQPMDNAYFDPNTITFSFGNGRFNFNSLTSLDVTSHEFGHGFAFFEVGFNNSGEARSLNEGFSDIWGATVENWTDPAKQTWLMGEEIMANGFSCLRSLRSPTTEGNRPGFFTEGNYPDTRLGPSWDVNNVDPHVNATVLGHWFFLVAQGGAGTNGLGNAFDVGNGLGIQTAALIAYNAELQLTPSADFISVRTASIQYARNHFGIGSCQEATVTNAWHAVGVGAVYIGNVNSTISGLGEFCTGSQPYTVDGSSVVWSAVIPAGVATWMSNGNTLTLTKGAGNGVVTLNATITNACGSATGIATKQITLGTPPAPTEIIGFCCNGTVFGGNSSYLFSVNPQPDINNYSWFVTYGSITDGQGTADMTATTGANKTPPPTFNVRIKWKNVCGWSSYFTRTGKVAGGASLIGNRTANSVALSKQSEKIYPIENSNNEGNDWAISPNPAQTNIIITTISKLSNGSFIREVSIYDASGRLRKQQKFNATSVQARIDISNLQAGVYFIEISNGEKAERKKLIVQK